MYLSSSLKSYIFTIEYRRPSIFCLMLPLELRRMGLGESAKKRSSNDINTRPVCIIPRKSKSITRHVDMDRIRAGVGIQIVNSMCVARSQDSNRCTWELPSRISSYSLTMFEGFSSVGAFSYTLFSSIDLRPTAA